LVYWDGVGPQLLGADSASTIQRGVTLVNVNGTINVAAGAYNEDVNLSKVGVSLLGAGAATTSIVGQLGGANDTVLLGSSNTRLSGFTITRVVGPGENNIGVTTVTGGSGIRIDNNVISQNRTAVYFNGNSSGCIVENNTITDNRTGMGFFDATPYTKLHDPQ
jgi:parallel beta-helix repeat protein